MTFLNHIHTISGERSKYPKLPKFIPSIFHHTSEAEKMRMKMRVKIF